MNNATDTDRAMSAPDAGGRDEELLGLFLSNQNAASTKNVYGLELRAFLRRAQKRVADVELADLLAYKTAISGLKTATIARKLKTVRLFFGFLYSQHYIPRDPTAGLKVPKVHWTEPDILTEEEAGALLRSTNDRRTLIGKRDFAMLSVLLSTGIRESELAGANVGSLVTKWGSTFLRVLGKGGKERLVKLPSEANEAVQEYLRARRAPGLEEPLFLTIPKRGLHPRRITATVVDYLVVQCAKRALIRKKVTPHLLRHTALSLLLANGAELARVSQTAGHSRTSTTANFYTHATREERAEDSNPLFTP
jgi:site-specific recombinase XerD